MEKPHTLTLETLCRAYSAGKQAAADYQKTGRFPEGTIYTMAPFKRTYDMGWKRGLKEATE